MSGRKRYERERVTDYLSAKIYGEERIAIIEKYCDSMGMSNQRFLEMLVDKFFEDEINWLRTMTKEQLIDYIINKK